MKVVTDAYEEEIEGDYGCYDGLCVTCRRCNHSVEVGGTSNASALKAAGTLREECPRGENNFYTVDWT